jgi:ribosomal protein S6--L-glutamate ligase
MQVAVLGPPESWYLKDLQRAACAAHSVVPIAWRDLASSVTDQGTQVFAGPVDLMGFDAVLVRTMPPGSLEQVIFRMDALAQLVAARVAVLNPPRAIETAIDKYLTLARLQHAGLPVPATVACQSCDGALRAFEHLGRDVVLKPLFGAEGRGLVRLQDRGLAERAFQLFSQQGAVLYLQEFVPHPGYDLRVFVAGSRLLAIRRHAQGDWRTNISCGGRAEPVEITDNVAQLARRAAEAVGASLAGVDLLPGPDGKLYLIEVNAVPGWRGLARATDVDVARLVLEHLEQVVQPRRSL